MSEYSLNDLYLKYTGSVGPAVEDDRYFQYLFESIQAGDKTLEQKEQTLHKVVDEEWLTTIEESLDPLFRVTAEPRRFVKTSEEIVPVGLAKKITADSVRHLSQNTQFIATAEEGNIQPTKILNVTTEDTYDLYENRFVYHLIQRLVAFIDKRTDVIFWSTGDETRNVLSFKSKVDDAWEQIEYNVEMKITNRQSLKENDDQNMDVFMRIDRVRRLVMSLRHSTFCEVMAGCSKVRSPIQRTNLIMKDPDYRACYSLWQFLERYDAVGYSIVEQDKAMEMDEEYLFQLYTNYIGNYALFKTLTEEDKRDVSTVIDQRRRTRKPKFIKHIREEIVEDRNIDVDEVRTVFVNEVTQAQLDAEAALEAEKQTTASLQSQLEEMSSELSIAQSMADAANMTAAMAEEAQHAAEAKQAEAEQKAADAENNAAIQINKAEHEAALKVNEAVAAKKEAEANAEDEKGRRIDAELARDKALEETKTAAAERDAAVEKMNTAVSEADARVAKIISDAKEKISQVTSETDARVAQITSETDAKIAQITSETDAKVAKAAADADAKVAETVEKTNAAIAATVSGANAKIESAETSARKLIAEANERAQKAIDEANAKAETEISEAKTMKAAAEQMVMEANESEAKAIAEKETALRSAADASEKMKAALLQSENDSAARIRAEELKAQTESAAAETRRKAEELSGSAEEKFRQAEEMLAQAQALKEKADALSAQAASQMAEAEQIRTEALEEAKAAKNNAKQALEVAEKADKRYRAAEKARLKAEEKAKEGTLGRYIVKRLNERRNKSEENSDKDL